MDVPKTETPVYATSCQATPSPTTTSFLPTVSSVREVVRRSSRWLRVADEVLQAVHNAREGALFSRLLAVASGTGSILRAILPYQSPQDMLLEQGYTRVRTGLGGFFCRLLSQSSLPHEGEIAGEFVRIVTWDLPGHPKALAAIYENDELADGPFVKGSPDLLGQAISDIVWADGQDIMLTSTKAIDGFQQAGSADNRRGAEFNFTPLPAPGVYFGSPDINWFTSRLTRHKGETRSMLLVGPSGVGKSTLGRLIAAGVGGGRLLKISGRALDRCTTTDVLDLVTFVQPSVLLLDDVTKLHDGGGTSEQLLELLESVHGRAKLVVATLMLENGYGRVRRDGDGSNYYSGMRPGRLDEVVEVKRPDKRIREEILLHYLGGKEKAEELGVTKGVLAAIVAKCEGLTGAYLREVVHRLEIHGVGKWTAEVASVKAAAPSGAREHASHLARARCRRRGRLSPSAMKKKSETLARRAAKLAEKAKAKEKT